MGGGGGCGEGGGIRNLPGRGVINAKHGYQKLYQVNSF